MQKNDGPFLQNEENGIDQFQTFGRHIHKTPKKDPIRHLRSKNQQKTPKIYKNPMHPIPNPHISYLLQTNCLIMSTSGPNAPIILARPPQQNNGQSRQ